MVRCCGPMCGSASFKNISGLSFHKFPKDQRLCNAWLKNMKLVNWKPYCGAVLCSRHFEESMFDRSSAQIRLRAGAVPTIFPELPVPYPTLISSKSNGTANNAEKFLVLKPIVCDSSDDSNNDKNDSRIRENSINDSDSSNDRVNISTARDDSNNDRANISTISVSDGDSETESDTYFEPIAEVTLKNTMDNGSTRSIGMDNRSTRSIGVQTKVCQLNMTNLRNKIKALRVQVQRRDLTIEKLQKVIVKMKSESCEGKNTINLICVDDMDE